MTHRRKTGKNNGLRRRPQALPPEAESEKIHQINHSCITPESVDNGNQRLASIWAFRQLIASIIPPLYVATNIKLNVNNRRSPFVGIHPQLHYLST